MQKEPNKRHRIINVLPFCSSYVHHCVCPLWVSSRLKSGLEDVLLSLLCANFSNNNTEPGNSTNPRSNDPTYTASQPTAALKE